MIQTMPPHTSQGKSFDWRPDVDSDRCFGHQIVVAKLHDDAFAIFRPLIALTPGWEVLSRRTWRQTYASPAPSFLSNATWRWYRCLRAIDSNEPMRDSHTYTNSDLLAMCASWDLAWRAAYVAGLIRQKWGLPCCLDDFGPEDFLPLHVRPEGMPREEFDRAVDEELTGVDVYADVDTSRVPIRLRLEPTMVCACASPLISHFTQKIAHGV
jgi:hypothetical protein